MVVIAAAGNDDDDNGDDDDDDDDNNNNVVGSGTGWIALKYLSVVCLSAEELQLKLPFSCWIFSAVH